MTKHEDEMEAKRVKAEDAKVEAEFVAAEKAEGEAAKGDTKAENHVVGSGESPSSPAKGDTKANKDKAASDMAESEAAKGDTKALSTEFATMATFDKAAVKAGPVTQDKVSNEAVEQARKMADASRVRDEANVAAGKREKAQIIVDSTDADKVNLVNAVDHSIETQVVGKDRDAKKALRVLAKLGTDEDPNVMNTVGFKNSKK